MPKKVSNPNLVVAGTKVITNVGPKEIDKIVDKVYFLWNGMAYSEATVKKVEEFGIQDQHNTVIITFDSNRVLEVARSFRFELTNGEHVKAKDLEVGALLHGWSMPGAWCDIATVESIQKGSDHEVMYSVDEPIIHRVVFEGIRTPDEGG